jgi:hypothetical protein
LEPALRNRSLPCAPPSRTVTSEPDCRSATRLATRHLTRVPMSGTRKESFWHHAQAGNVIYS